MSSFPHAGSLAVHLASAALPLPLALRIMTDAVSGLCHLHTEIVGTQGKPSLAHTNISAKVNFQSNSLAYLKTII